MTGERQENMRMRGWEGSGAVRRQRTKVQKILLTRGLWEKSVD